jgi:methionyl aminopeptidase
VNLLSISCAHIVSEPVICEGKPESRAASDGWAYTTVDGKRAAQREETIIITKSGAEILTIPDESLL